MPNGTCPPLDGPYHGDFPADMYATFIDEIPVKGDDCDGEEGEDGNVLDEEDV